MNVSASLRIIEVINFNLHFNQLHFIFKTNICENVYGSNFQKLEIFKLSYYAHSSYSIRASAN